MSDEEGLRPGDFLFKPTTDQLENTVSTLEEMEREMIRRAIERNDGNLSTVAVQLGITRQTLYNKIKKFNL